MWKKGITILTLSAVFVLFLAAIILSFVADLQFNLARKLEAGYRWQKAEKKYALAIRLDPFNSEYNAGMGRFLYHQSFYQEDKLSLLKRAEFLARRAIRLNPRQAQYYLDLGLINLRQEDFPGAMNNFRKAIECDPNGTGTSFAIGYATLATWKDLNQKDKEFVLERLRYVLRLKPEYKNRVYSRVWDTVNDLTLLQSIKPQKTKEQIKEETQRIEALKKAASAAGRQIANTVLPKDWQGKSADGKNVFKNGNMYWNGTIEALIAVPENATAIKIKAKGSSVFRIWPLMIVELDAEEIGEIFVDSPEWKEYTFKINSVVGIRVLSVTFANDAEDKKTGKDRNLYVAEARAE